MRDIHLTNNTEYEGEGKTAFDSLLDSLDNLTATYAARIQNKFTDTKWIIVGGHAAIHDTDLYTWANLLIPNYRADILGYDVPECQTLGQIEQLTNYKDVFGTEVLLEETNKNLLIDDISKGRKDIFWDGIHINALYSNILSKRILDFLE